MPTSRTLGPHHHGQEPTLQQKRRRERTQRRPSYAHIQATNLQANSRTLYVLDLCGVMMNRGLKYRKRFMISETVPLYSYNTHSYQILWIITVASMEYSDHSFSGKGVEACTPPPVLVLRAAAKRTAPLPMLSSLPTSTIAFHNFSVQPS